MLRQSTHPLQELCLLCLLFLLWPDLREKVAQQQCWKMIWILKISRNLFVVTSSQLMTGPLLSPSTLTTCRLFHVVNFKTDFFSATINECAPFWKRIQRQIRLILHLSYLLYWCQIEIRIFLGQNDVTQMLEKSICHFVKLKTKFHFVHQINWWRNTE